MSNEKFTQGVWAKTAQFTVGIAGGWLSTQMSGDVDSSVAEREANAHLIAAAPDMYRALRDVAGEIPVTPNQFGGKYATTLTQDEVDAIRAALAKADGEV